MSFPFRTWLIGILAGLNVGIVLGGLLPSAQYRGLAMGIVFLIVAGLSLWLARDYRARERMAHPGRSQR